MTLIQAASKKFRQQSSNCGETGKGCDCSMPVDLPVKELLTYGRKTGGNRISADRFQIYTEENDRKTDGIRISADHSPNITRGEFLPS
jgi:hypothetical protein